MKRLAILAILAAFILGTVATASAVDIKAKGSWRVVFQWNDNTDFAKEDGEDDFAAIQRARTYFEFVASENLKAVLKLEIGDLRWGENDAATKGNDAAFGADGVNIETKNAYLAFNFNDIAVKAGIQGLALPGTFSNQILDDDVAALVVSVPVNDMVSLTAGWARPYDTQTSDTAGKSVKDEMDIALAILNVDTDGFAIKPYFVYSWIGKDSGFVATANDDYTAWWAGLNAQVTMLDPIVILADFTYGSMDTGNDDSDQSGWILDLAIDYKMDAMTPEVFFVYSTGQDDGTDNEVETMPRVGGDFTATTFYFNGSALSSGNLSGSDATGLCALGFKLKDMSFVEGMTHTLAIMYAKGTTDKDYVENGNGDSTLTTKDSLLEVNFDTKYQVYEQLAAIVELGYIKVNYDEDLGTRGNDYKDEAAWKLAVGFKYDF